MERGKGSWFKLATAKICVFVCLAEKMERERESVSVLLLGSLTFLPLFFLFLLRLTTIITSGN